jgi:hypothetical protein
MRAGVWLADGPHRAAPIPDDIESAQGRIGMAISRMRQLGLIWRRLGPVKRRGLALATVAGVALLTWFVSFISPGIWDCLLGRCDPLAVNVEIDPPVGVNGPSNNFLIPKPIHTVSSAPQECGSMRRWVRDLGGADAMATNIRLTLQARSNASTDVIVRGKVQILRRADNMDGSHVTCEPGGDLGVPRHVRIALDEEPSDWTYFVFDRHVNGPAALTIGPGESEMIDLRVLASKGMYYWKVKLELLVDGHRKKISIDDDGQPFVTSGVIRGRPTYIFRGNIWQRT